MIDNNDVVNNRNNQTVQNGFQSLTSSLRDEWMFFNPSH